MECLDGRTWCFAFEIYLASVSDLQFWHTFYWVCKNFWCQFWIRKSAIKENIGCKNWQIILNVWFIFSLNNEFMTNLLQTQRTMKTFTEALNSRQRLRIFCMRYLMKLGHMNNTYFLLILIVFMLLGKISQIWSILWGNQ